MKLVGETLLLLGINFVDGEEERPARADQLTGELDVRRSHFGATVHHHDDRVGLEERDFRLAKDFRRDEVFVFRQYAAGIHDP